MRSLFLLALFLGCSAPPPAEPDAEPPSLDAAVPDSRTLDAPVSARCPSERVNIRLTPTVGGCNETSTIDLTFLAIFSEGVWTIADELPPNEGTIYETRDRCVVDLYRVLPEDLPNSAAATLTHATLAFDSAGLAESEATLRRVANPLSACVHWYDVEVLP